MHWVCCAVVPTSARPKSCTKETLAWEATKCLKIKRWIPILLRIMPLPLIQDASLPSCCCGKVDQIICQEVTCTGVLREFQIFYLRNTTWNWSLLSGNLLRKRELAICSHKICSDKRQSGAWNDVVDNKDVWRACKRNWRMNASWISWFLLNTPKYATFWFDSMSRAEIYF